jgi:hypothetical protein
MITYVNTPVKVGVVFGGDKKVRPVWFVWEKQEYRIKEITYTWSSKEGVAELWHFSVIDQNDNLYELCYHDKSMLWMLHQEGSE